MPELRYAQIGFKDDIAGTLSETPAGGTRFDYAPGFGETIACALPRAEDSHLWPTGLHPFFEHLAPEGWLRGRQARAAEIEVEDDFGLLLRYGGDCIGAVSVQAPEAGALSFAGKELDALTRAAVTPKRTVSGVQPKLLVTRAGGAFVPAAETGPAPYIAKFPTDDLGDIVVNEDWSLTAARILLGSGQVTAATRALVQGIDTPALLVTRFDRTPDGGKLRLEDFAQILSRPRRRDFSGKYDGAFEDGAELIRRHSTRAEIDLLRYFQRITAFALIGNCDCHLKNFSLLETADGLRLSPAYDVVNTYVYASRGISTAFGLRLGGRKRLFSDIGRDVLTAFGGEIGLREAAIERTYAGFSRRRDAVLAVPGASQNDDPQGLPARWWATVAEAFLRILGVG